MIILLACLSLIACSEDENKVEQEPSIYGTWQLSQIYSDPGTGEGGWIDIDNGYNYKIVPGGTFSSTKFNECSDGTYSITNQTIDFTFNCTDFTPCEEDSQTCSENFTLEDQFLVLTPNYLECDEGCAYRFTKISKTKSGE